MFLSSLSFFFFFFNDTATTEIYTLSLHDALPILHQPRGRDRSRQSVRAVPHHDADPRVRISGRRWEALLPLDERRIRVRHAGSGERAGAGYTGPASDGDVAVFGRWLP